MSVGMISSQVVFNGSITSDKPRLDNEFITISRVSMAIKVFDRNSAVDETYLSPVHLSPFPLYLFTTKLLLLVLPLYKVSMMMMIDCRTEALLSVTTTCMTVLMGLVVQCHLCRASCRYSELQAVTGGVPECVGSSLELTRITFLVRCSC